MDTGGLDRGASNTRRPTATLVSGYAEWFAVSPARPRAPGAALPLARRRAIFGRFVDRTPLASFSPQKVILRTRSHARRQHMCHIYGEVASRLPLVTGRPRQSPRSVAARLRAVVLVVSPCSTPSAFPASARTRAAAPAHCHRQRSSALSLALSASRSEAGRAMACGRCL